VVGTLGALAVLVTAFVLDPDAGEHGASSQLGLPPCQYHAQTGKPCLSCGLTTSLTCVAHLRLGDAFRANPAGIALFFLVLAIPPWLVLSAIRRQDPFRFLTHPKGRWILPGMTAIVVLAWASRFFLGWPV
jgi:hypothetical protein